MNALVKNVIGEASALSGPGGVEHNPQPPYPDEIESGAVQAVTGQASEERAEVRIGNEILKNLSMLPPLARRDFTLREIARLAQELIDMHKRS